MNEQSLASEFAADVAAKRRFRFGRNWQRFLANLTDERIAQAEKSIRQMLELETLTGLTFIDVGSGSGLFSLAAARLGAKRVHSFDFDPDSVWCTQQLKMRYAPGFDHWTIEQGSALDGSYVKRLGSWDIVYSWGVLHHTGDMWTALANVAELVGGNGILFVSIYNDQGPISSVWRALKSLYNRNAFGRVAVLTIGLPYFVASGIAADIVARQNLIARYRRSNQGRGMSTARDWFDWLGGYPFEVAKPEQIFSFYRRRGFALRNLTTCGGRLGCNQFVFRKDRAGNI